ncbi:TIGR03943 family putative permease subunit [Amycolatopsis cihanbeyliensis]|uniref:Putative repeat protein (TIGR03943 family) n=1 Tax=Amycolatopsis cihanbeyliensis TaxID=1128664 RepID=A0A542CTH6_AMYCI|nr:TIGR03943 family protein [Amycolatopsis cihanbeyliensis]TQI94121.1 putative repeat protein (TIGR03943 family) [Amycolatopsis cihanbeyliensis]
MRRETQNILLVLLGGALLKIAINGDYLRYVKPSQQVWVLGGGAVMVALGVLAMARDLLAARGTPGPQACGHEHHHAARSAWLLMVPVLAVFLVAPPALGSDSVTRTPARAPQSEAARDAATFPPLPAGEVVPLPVSEFVTRAGWDSGGTLDDRTVSLSGFVVHDGGDTLLARLRISCCAADAFPLTVRLTGPAATTAVAAAADTWIEVTGQAVPDTATAENGYTPDLTVRTVREVPAPEDPYEY